MHNSKYLRRFSFGSEVCSITPSSLCSLMAGHRGAQLVPSKKVLEVLLRLLQRHNYLPHCYQLVLVLGEAIPYVTAQIICETPDVTIKCTNSVPSPELTKQK